MTLTAELDLYRVNVNLHAGYRTHTDRLDRVLCLDH